MLTSDLQQIFADFSAHLTGDSTFHDRQADPPQFLEHRFAETGSPLALCYRALRLLLSRSYGRDAISFKNGVGRLSSLCSAFIQLYGDGPIEILRAPARINILGEHVDYVSYLPTFSLPFGSREHDMLMLLRPTSTGEVRGASSHPAYPPFNFAINDCPGPRNEEDPEAAWLSHLFEAPAPFPHWGNYVKGACYYARVKYGERVARGYEFLVDSTIPPSGGASSSSALVVLAGAAIRIANGLRFRADELAFDSSRAEWYVGTRGGAMDHLTICLAKSSHVVRISYREQSTKLLPLPGEQLRWVTFFSHPADKGREIMLEYNERAAVSRLLIPALIAKWKHSDERRYVAWNHAVESMFSAPSDGVESIETLIAELPETITLAQVENDLPDAYRECALAFPMLVNERQTKPLRVRSYALHHLGEIRRVASAEEALKNSNSGIEGANEEETHAATVIGNLLNDSHLSLRDHYGVSTPDVEELIRTILSDPRVYGARLMGGGFGGNVLALTSKDYVGSLIDRVQAEFYAPRERNGLKEGSVMVSTPGDGLSELGSRAILRAAVEMFNASGAESEHHRRQIGELLDSMPSENVEVWPIIVAAGKGSRAMESGLSVPKPVAPIFGLPAINHVLANIRAAAEMARSPVVIVSPETELQVRQALSGQEILVRIQIEPKGTGDAVLCAYEPMKDFKGRALVIWSTQPIITPQSISRTIKLSRLFGEFDAIVPTALKERPYAPLERDSNGRVLASRETHLEKADVPELGETNCGMFLLDNQRMFEALYELRSRHWVEAEQSYDRPGGELGFPNEMINYFAAKNSGVFASPILDEREVQGIKTLEDVERCERFIAELSTEKT